MGTSNWQNISYSVELIRQIQPKSVLDVGCGFGRWGFLCREFLDVWEGRTYPESWVLRIEGIEVFPRNVTPAHSYIYDRVHVGDAKSLIGSLGEYDLMIFGDVLEHFQRDEAEHLLKVAMERTSKGILIHIPIGSAWHQGSRDGNAHENHLSSWNVRDLKRYGAKTKVFRDYLGRPFAVALIPMPGLKLPTALGLSLLRWRLAREHDAGSLWKRLRGREQVS